MRYIAQARRVTVRFSDSGMKSRSCRSVVFPALAGSILLSLVGYLPLTATAAWKPEEPLPIGSSKQLFLGPWTQDGRDGHLVASMQNVTLTMNQAQVVDQKLVVRDRPWEGSRLLDMSTFVIKDGDVFRLYYGALAKYPKLWEEPNCRIICYAESRDGIHWEKPNLGLFSWEGSRQNNIIIPNDQFPYVMSEFAGPGVFIDPVARVPEERYKMILKATPVRGPGELQQEALPKGQYLFASGDGVRWRLLSPRKVNPGASDTKFSVFWDAESRRYVTYTRVKHQQPDSPKVLDLSRYHLKQYGLKLHVAGRLVGRIDSPDLFNWSEERAVLATDAADHQGLSEAVLHQDQEDGGRGEGFRGGVDIYGGNISRYWEAENAYLGLPLFFYHWKKGPARVGEHEVADYSFPGTVDVQLVTSRDGIRFHRAPGRRPFIRLGPRGSWWSRMIWPAGSVIRVGDELWIYFSGHDVAHNQEQELLVSSGAHGRAVLRLDGFISADTDYQGGELVTRPLVFDGERLQLNLDTSAGGVVRVELQDAQGSPLEGFELSRATEINGNYVRVTASWEGGSDVGSLAGRPVRLRFVMRDSRLYSFQFLPGASVGSDG